MLSPATSILLLVDFQTRLMPAITGGSEAVANACRLADAARLVGVPVLATEQNPEGLGPNLDEIRSRAAAVFTKRHFDATREATWRDFLPSGRRDIIVAGCETHVCVMQTVMGLLGASSYTVRLVRDAVGSRTVANREAALARAEKHGAELVTTEMVIFEWLATCDHPRFREALKLVR